jgi:hypothetical protein
MGQKNVTSYKLIEATDALLEATAGVALPRKIQQAIEALPLALVNVRKTAMRMFVRVQA